MSKQRVSAKNTQLSQDNNGNIASSVASVVAVIVQSVVAAISNKNK